jgi:hypothetical protein
MVVIGLPIGKDKKVCQNYSGWSNRETWALMLHINNDEGLSGMLHDSIAEYTRGATPENLTYQTSKALQDFTESLFTRSGYSEIYGDVWPDCLVDIAEDIGSLYRIDYYECAESILSDMEG